MSFLLSNTLTSHPLSENHLRSNQGSHERNINTHSHLKPTPDSPPKRNGPSDRARDPPKYRPTPAPTTSKLRRCGQDAQHSQPSSPERALRMPPRLHPPRSLLLRHPPARNPARHPRETRTRQAAPRARRTPHPPPPPPPPSAKPMEKPYARADVPKQPAPAAIPAPAPVSFHPLPFAPIPPSQQPAVPSPPPSSPPSPSPPSGPCSTRHAALSDAMGC